MESLFYKIQIKLLWFLKPIQLIIQWLGRETNAEPRMTKSKVEKAKSFCKPGMTVLSHEDNRPSNVAIKGYWDHASIISRDEFLMEAVGDQFENGKNIGGVREVDIEEWLYKKDDVCIIEVLGTSEQTKSLAGANSFSFKGLNYNYGFDLDDKKTMFCSGLVYHCWKIEIPSFMATVLKRKKTIIPQDYYDIAQNKITLKVVYDSRNDV